ncbi:MAG: nuclear transport factor 2 family protein [Ferruginibacter sp.]|nr:nuclear transport factor 2 family protein [Ferruginibacter sp.]
MRILFVLFVSFFLPYHLEAQSSAETMIRKILSNQETAWNNGDLKTYMSGYWNNDSLMFIGKTGIKYGWQTTFDSYMKNYPDAESMGTLTFEVIEIKKLSPIYYYVTGKWMLTRSIGNLFGHFTLLFKNINGNWKIISDHSS